MSALVCTLFEGDYHLGVAGLINSLVRSGFRGEVRAGFRGELPEWAHGKAEKLKPEKLKLASGRRTAVETADSPLHQLTDSLPDRPTDSPANRLTDSPIHRFKVGGCEIVFQRLDTKAHFTNYKPDFLLQLLEAAGDVERLFYLDPDIVVESRWAFFEEWADAGVALAEDVNSPLPENHPRRVAWRRKFGETGMHLHYRQPAYINGGFIGLRTEHRGFLERWRQTQDLVSAWVGGADRAKIGGGIALGEQPDPNDAFSSTDQDALNAAAEASGDIPLSIIGKEAMGFTTGGCIMHHALGPWKPWRRHYLREALGGVPPARVDKLFWQLLGEGPIKPLPDAVVTKKQREVKLASAIGRFIRRS